MVTENLTFANFVPDQHGIDAIYKIGANKEHGGVIPEMATAFEHELSTSPGIDNLGALIGKVGPAKELQENITRVQEALGTDGDAVAIARTWAERSGLLSPVERSYLSTEQTDAQISLGVMTGGVRNWMVRRANKLAELSKARGIEQALLIAGNRVMKSSEGTDVEDGMTEADYMKSLVASQLEELGIVATVVPIESSLGDEIMGRGVKKIGELIDPRHDRIAVVSNAGAWVQNVGQLRRAVIRTYGNDFDKDGQQILAVSDGFALGTGVEPTSTHQNPFSAAGQIARNAQELARHFA